jgi:hypothetical protein
MTEELKPCPFCGTTEGLYPSYRGLGAGKPYAIDCVGCGMDFTPREGMDVIASWNRRTAGSVHESLRLRAALEQARAALNGEPEYHHQGMGCGLEDRNISDRYDAMAHGWECAIERVCAEHINPAVEIIDAALHPDQQKEG